MPPDSSQHVLDRYRRDGDARDVRRLAEAYRPLVRSVCRRYLRAPQDVDDAVQETFLRLARHAPSIDGSLVAWLTAVAHSAAVDLIRRQGRERRRRRHLAHLSPAAAAEHGMVHELITRKLGEALLCLDPSERRLITERFFRKTPLRLLADPTTSVATVSRRVSAAVTTLAAVLRDMGVASADDLTLAEHFGDPAHVPPADDLRFAADWHAPLADPPAARAPADLLPGWSRPVRVGVLISHATTRILMPMGTYMGIEEQVRSARLLAHPGLHLVAIAEPDTTGLPPVERTLRDYALTGGLIDATDADALRTLDVIIIGLNLAMTAPIVSAINAAVRAGVGLLNEWWTGDYDAGRTNVELAQLFLADSPVHTHHVGNCLQFLPATVVESHPLLPGLRPGGSFPVSACGPIYRVSPAARLLVAKDLPVRAEQHRIPGLGDTLRMPVVAVGTLGAGRVAVVNTYTHSDIADHLTVTLGEYLLNFLTWLADPRREG